MDEISYADIITLIYIFVLLLQMKLLAFVDLHARMELLKMLVARAQKKDIDVVVCAGDFSIFENQMTAVLRKLDVLNKPIVIIPGNHETPSHLKHELSKYRNFVLIHNNLWKYKGWVFLGWGTDGFSTHSEEFRKTERWWRQKLTVADRNIILVTHAPPNNTELDNLNGSHVGNIDIRKGIERIKPKLHICGHLHENAGKEGRIGSTTIVNPGWKGMVIEVK